MTYVTVEEEDSQRVLLVFSRMSPLTHALFDYFSYHSASIVVKKNLPHELSKYDYCLIFDPSDINSTLDTLSSGPTKMKSCLLVSLESEYSFASYAIEQSTLRNCKVIHISPDQSSQDIVESIIWFMQSAREIKLTLYRKDASKKPKTIFKKQRKSSLSITRRKISLGLIFVFVAINTFFLFPLASSFIHIKNASDELRVSNAIEAQLIIRKGKKYKILSEKAYAIARPTLSLFFVGFYFDNILNVQKISYSFLDNSLTASINTQSLIGLISKKERTIQESKYVADGISTLKSQITKMESESKLLIQKVPSYPALLEQRIRLPLIALHEHLSEGRKLISQAEKILSEEDKRYLVYFYNNMELRPGGGFIGSFGVLETKNRGLSSLTVYDVYDADGQLKGHIEPPKPIRSYLNQPHWFLRDSNFSPDFEVNAQMGNFFLEKEMDLGSFDGSIGITTTALAYILEAFGSVHLPDYNDTITADNFFLKTQTEIEENFFPGSIKKKTLLAHTAEMLLLKLEEASTEKLLRAIKKSLEEKHIVFSFNDSSLQKLVEEAGWHGKMVSPMCVSTDDTCIKDYQFHADANLGVNKVNYYIERSIKISSSIDSYNLVSTVLSTTFYNGAVGESFPGGIYKNYYQIFLPNQTHIKDLRINGVAIREYDLRKSGNYTVVGVYIEVPPQETTTAELVYSVSHDKLLSKQSSYQLIIQKQIGSINTDVSLEITFPNSVTVTGTNFPALAKKNVLLYNTSLSKDRIFVVDFSKNTITTP